MDLKKINVRLWAYFLLVIVSGGIVYTGHHFRSSYLSAAAASELQQHSSAQLLADIKLKREEQAKEQARIDEQLRLQDEEKARQAAEAEKLAAQAKAQVAATKPAPVKVTPKPAAPPASLGAYTYVRRTVSTSRGGYSADVLTADLASGKVKVITDTAADGDCKDQCPVIPLSQYISRNGGFAGINGTYFCPKDYSWCAGQVNSFFWKVYNTRLGKFINATNGMGENDPVIAFSSSGQARYFSSWNSLKSSGFAVSAAVNHGPGLVADGAVSVNESKLDDKQRTAKATRAALGIKGQTIYAVVARGATVVDLAYIMQALGVDSALNLDGGGSSALYYNGRYMVGPGRALPNAIIFANK